MKNFLRVTTALAAVAFAGSAFAADLPRRAAPPPVFTPVPVFTWTGFYAGFNAGYGFDVSDDRNNLTYGYLGPANGVFPTGVGLARLSNRNSVDGFVGGGQIGYNYQFTPGSGIVVGLEADGQYADLGRRRQGYADLLGTIPGGARFSNPSGISSLEFFGTARGRVGYAFDRVLFYGTAGFAYGSTGEDFRNSNTDDFRTGYTVGGGIEYALPTDSFLNFFRSSAVTFKMEGLYVNLDRNSRDAVIGINGNSQVRLNNPNLVVLDSTSGAVVNKSGLRNDTEFAVIRAGINYKFGSY